MSSEVTQQSLPQSVQIENTQNENNTSGMSNTSKLGIGIVTSIIIIVIILVLLYFLKIKPSDDLILSLQTDITNYKKQIEEQKSSLNVNSNDIKDLVTKIKLKEDEIKTLNNNLTTKTNEITGLKSQVDSKTNDLKTKTNEITGLKSQVDSKTNEINRLNNDLLVKTNEIVTKTNTITNLNNNITNITAEMNTYKELYDVIRPYIQSITITGVINPNDKRKLEQLLVIINGIKDKLNTVYTVVTLSDMKDKLDTLVDKMNIMKNKLAGNGNTLAIDNITETKVNDLIIAELNKLLETLPTETQATYVYNNLKTFVKLPSNATSTDINNAINALNTELNNNINLYSSSLNGSGTVDTTSPLTNKLSNIFNNLSVTKQFYDLIKSTFYTNIDINPPTEFNYIIPSTTTPSATSDGVKEDIKNYIENSLKFLKYIQTNIPSVSNESNINSLQTLKTRLETIKTLADQVSNLNTQVSNLNTQIINLNTQINNLTAQLASYKDNGVDNGLINKNKLRNVMLTKGWDIYNVPSSTEGQNLFNYNSTEKGPAFDIGYCMSDPIKCGTQVMTATGKVFKRNPQGAANSLRLSKEDNKDLYVLLNQPYEIDFTGLGAEYYDPTKPTHVKTKILENSILMNTSLDDDSAIGSAGGNFPDCLKNKINNTTDPYDAAKIGQYGPNFGNTIIGYDIDNSTTYNMNIPKKFDGINTADGSYPNYRLAEFYGNGERSKTRIYKSSGQYDEYKTNLSDTPLCPSGQNVVYIPEARVGKFYTNNLSNPTADNVDEWDNTNNLAFVKLNSMVSGNANEKDSGSANNISNNIKNILGNNIFGFNDLTYVGINNTDRFPGSEKLMQMRYKCGKSLYENTGPWCNVYKKRTPESKFKLYPKSGHMVYIKNPNDFDFTGI